MFFNVDSSLLQSRIDEYGISILNFKVPAIENGITYYRLRSEGSDNMSLAYRDLRLLKTILEILARIITLLTNWAFLGLSRQLITTSLRLLQEGKPHELINY
jgi:hypothetical protein